MKRKGKGLSYETYVTDTGRRKKARGHETKNMQDTGLHTSQSSKAMQ